MMEEINKLPPSNPFVYGSIIFFCLLYDVLKHVLSVFKHVDPACGEFLRSWRQIAYSIIELMP